MVPAARLQARHSINLEEIKIVNSEIFFFLEDNAMLSPKYRDLAEYSLHFVSIFISSFAYVCILPSCAAHFLPDSIKQDKVEVIGSLKLLSLAVSCLGNLEAFSPHYYIDVFCLLLRTFLCRLFFTSSSPPPRLLYACVFPSRRKLAAVFLRAVALSAVWLVIKLPTFREKQVCVKVERRLRPSRLS